MRGKCGHNKHTTANDYHQQSTVMVLCSHPRMTATVIQYAVCMCSVYEEGTVYILLLNNGTEAIDVWLMDPYTFILIRSPVHGATFEI